MRIRPPSCLSTASKRVFRTLCSSWDKSFGMRSFPGSRWRSWPSGGEITAYDYDSEKCLTLSRSIFARRWVSKIYVVTHSMGNQIVTGALAQASKIGVRIALTELVFAAPDVDRDVFVFLSNHLKSVAKGITLYASSADKALLAVRYQPWCVFQC
jgi:esterase/lipase superfamily enzyme